MIIDSIHFIFFLVNPFNRLNSLKENLTIKSTDAAARTALDS